MHNKMHNKIIMVILIMTIFMVIITTNVNNNNLYILDCQNKNFFLIGHLAQNPFHFMPKKNTSKFLSKNIKI